MASALASEIRNLCAEKNALVLSHYYQDSEIQDVADFIGDSYQLAKIGRDSKAQVIVLCGVVFMAESVKAMSPEKTVLVPDLNAGCSLVKGTPTDEFRAWRSRYPDAIAVTYINSSLEVKALSDVIVTSSNAESVIAAIPKDRKILFAPDRHLGRYMVQKTGREMELWPGACEVHVLFSARRLHEMMKDNPDALVIAHPECDDQILAQADVIGSTSHLLSEVQRRTDVKKFIVATETGILHQMQKARPEVTLLQAPTDDQTCQCNDCPYMKLSTMEKIAHSLRTLSPEISVPENVRKLASVPLQRMMDITAGNSTVWPEPGRTAELLGVSI